MNFYLNLSIGKNQNTIHRFVLDAVVNLLRYLVFFSFIGKLNDGEKDKNNKDNNKILRTKK